LQGRFVEGGGWLTRSIAAFVQAHDQGGAKQSIGNFLILHRRSTPSDKQELEAIWRDAAIGAFPTEPSP
jgi:hypothetical protein